MEMFIRDNRVAIQGSVLEIVVSHDGEEISWEAATLGLTTYPVIFNGVTHTHLVASKRDMIVTTYDPFEQINGYWSQLSAVQVKNIFETYKEIFDAFNYSEDRSSLTFQLYGLVAKLLDQHNLEDVEHWISFRSNVYFGSTTLKTEYIEAPDKRTTREQTYLKEDYVRLVTLSVVLRTMMPVWGAFISTTRDDHGTWFKEYYAFDLMKSSKLITSTAMEKLETYLKFTIATNKVDNYNSILKGISTENFPTWILSLVTVRRLCLGDVRGLENSTTLISTIYGFCINKIKGGENGPNSANGVKPKTFENKNDPEKAASRLEGYKIKQDIPPGDIVALEDAVSDPYLVAKQLQPGIPDSLVTDALKSSAVLLTNRIYDGQITLMQWVVSPVINPRGIGYLCKESVVRLLAVSQAVLWFRGSKELAGIITAGSIENQNNFNSSGESTYVSIPKNLKEELTRLFPYERRPSLKKKTTKLLNTATISINLVVDLLTANTWRLTLSEKHVLDLHEGKNHRRFPVPKNIRVLLATLVIELAGGSTTTII